MNVKRDIKHINAFAVLLLVAELLPLSVWLFSLIVIAPMSICLTHTMGFTNIMLVFVFSTNTRILFFSVMQMNEDENSVG